MKQILIFAAFFYFVGAKFVNLSDTYISDLQLTACSAGNVITVENVTLQIGANKKMYASGTLITTEDLASPIKASVVMKKKTFVGWMKIPCEKHMGSCVYEDLCSYGVPPTKDCPEKLKDHNIPCRCPLHRGTYVLPPTRYEFEEEKSVLTGKYKGIITIEHSSQTLSCYNLRFTLKT